MRKIIIGSMVALMLCGGVAACGGKTIAGKGAPGLTLVPAGTSLADTHSGAVAFFTMMGTVARQPQVGGEHRLQTSATVQDPRIAYWINYGSREWRSQTLPTPGTKLDVRAFLTRCRGGTAYKYGVPGLAEQLNGPDDPSIGKWVVDEANSTMCRLDEAGGANPADGLLTGGLTAAQASQWVQTLTNATVRDSGKPLFEFGNPRTDRVAGKQVVAVEVSVNPSVKGRADALGQVGQTLVRAVGDGFPYTGPGDSLDGFRATYWIDPVSHLPVKSTGHVVTSPADHRGGFAWRYETTYRFGTEPDWNALPVK